jgi:hypothetical protein
VVEIAFDVDLTRRDLGILAAGSASYMLAIAIAQALIALHGQSQAALAWLAGVIGFVVVTALGHDLYLRVEVGLLAGSGVALIGMTAFVLTRIRHGADITSGDLIAALHEFPLEP